MTYLLTGEPYRYVEGGNTIQYFDTFLTSHPVEKGHLCCERKWRSPNNLIFRYNLDGTWTTMEGFESNHPDYGNGGIWVKDLC